MEEIRAWRPDVPLVQEVLHARFDTHAYPVRTHDSWAVLLLDEGAVAYDLDRHEHRAVPAAVTLLPPHVPHDGRSALPGQPFRKRVLYLDPEWLPGGRGGLPRPVAPDPALPADARHDAGRVRGLRRRCCGCRRGEIPRRRDS